MSASLEVRTYARRAVLVIGVVAAYRSIFIPIFPAGPDECFYWDWSRRLDLSYVEHPPMVAYAIAAMTAVFGDAPWAPRVLASILAMTTSWLLFGTGRRLFDARVGFWAATFHAVCPMFSMAGGALLVPESLLVFWTALALDLASRLLVSGRMSLFYALGAVAGAALLAKYPGALIPAAVGLFALLSPRHRRWFACKEPYIAVLIALAIFSPVIVWNIQHDGAGLSFIADRTVLTAEQPGVHRAWQSFTAQAAYHSPVLFVLLWYGVGVAARRAWTRADDRSLLLFCFSGPVMVLFLVVSTFRYTLPHWIASACLAAYVAAPAALLTGAGETHAVPRKARIALSAAALVAALESLLLPILLVYPLTTVAYSRVQQRLKLPPHVVEPMAEAFGWGGVVRERILALRERIIEETGATPVVLTHYHMLAGLLAYNLRDVGEVVSVHAMARQYDVWFDDEDLLGKTVIYVSADNSIDFQGAPTDYYRFAECAAQPPIAIVARDVTINHVYLWVCTGYAGAVNVR